MIQTLTPTLLRRTFGQGTGGYSESGDKILGGMTDDELTRKVAAFIPEGGKVKLGKGVVGKSASVALAAFTVLLVLAFRIDPAYLLYVLGALALLFLCWLGGVLHFAHKNPGAALLEGAELIAWEKLSSKAALKGGGLVLDSNSFPEPNAIIHSIPADEVVKPDDAL